ncbi:MAG TPA: FtsX-like permease family protein [Jiangellaceae bacterium]
MRVLFTLRWAARDLRRRWLQVLVIALIIAIGTGVYAGLGSTAEWRRQSNDASFDLLNMYDLRVTTARGVDAAVGEMAGVLASLPDPAMVATAEERFIADTQVDASTADESILVPGRLVGMDLRDGGPHVNGVYVDEGDGRSLSESDAGQPVVLVEQNFANFYDLQRERTFRVAGGQEVTSVGVALGPEYFFVMTEEGGFFAEANFAVLFTSLETAQQLAGRAARVNDLVLALAPGVDAEVAARDIEAVFAESGAGLGVTVMQTRDEDAYRVLYDDIESDQRFWNLFAILILGGAAFGAFNLAGRMVEAERREIGIGMALGWSRRRLAVRHLLVGAQIALAGAVLGVVMTFVVLAAVRPIFESMLPLPVWSRPWQPGMFIQGAVIGFVLPFLATAWPVWRAVRVMPVDAITTTHASARSGLAPLLRRLRWPVSAFRRMPLGNVLRAPRRTLLTALGIGAAISTLVVVLGALDSFKATIDRNSAELFGEHPDRIMATFSGFVVENGPELAAVAAADSVGRVEPVLEIGGTLSTPEHADVEVVLAAIDFDSDVWAPTFDEGGLGADRAGLVLAQKAADDLGVGVGDTIMVEHPARQGGGFTVVQTPMTVAGIHPSPFRFNAYLDRAQLTALGVSGAANAAYLLPAAGATPDDVEQELFGMSGVASVQPVAVSSQVVEDSFKDFTEIFQVLEVFIFGLALLIAYNATSINADERARERATLFAFGMPLRRVLGLETVEGTLIGLLGTAVGVGLGLLLNRSVIASMWESTMPDIGMEVGVSVATLLTAVAFGVAAVVVAPLFTARRLSKMDIPGTLRVVE